MDPPLRLEGRPCLLEGAMQRSQPQHPQEIMGRREQRQPEGMRRSLQQCPQAVMGRQEQRQRGVTHPPGAMDPQEEGLPQGMDPREEGLPQGMDHQEGVDTLQSQQQAATSPHLPRGEEGAPSSRCRAPGFWSP